MSCSWAIYLRVIWYPLPSCDWKWTKKHLWPKGRSPFQERTVTGPWGLGPSSVTPS